MAVFGLLKAPLEEDVVEISNIAFSYKCRMLASSFPKVALTCGLCIVYCRIPPSNTNFSNARSSCVQTGVDLISSNAVPRGQAVKLRDVHGYTSSWDRPNLRSDWAFRHTFLYQLGFTQLVFANHLDVLKHIETIFRYPGLKH
eukprot:CAMPEP_0180503472 /NCGR_PEP_ID=MMETSP1036_2-20121128/46065_1 /TAXON_ID=632150 /ORGANISM="Azadinium spinosum, Strain 3D9" /LENGTH=142 /DNA_ID=CAMNT_0022512531 /DNA_START=762 /DNA_END=1190 /DNA_ORIENTATION=-